MTPRDPQDGTIRDGETENLSPEYVRHRIAELEQRVAELTGLVSEMIWETDAELRLTAISQHIVDALGFAPSELIGKSVLEVGAFDAYEPDGSTELFLHPFRNRGFQIADKAGDLHNFRISSNPIFDQETGAFLGARGTADDDTLRRTADLALRDGEKRYRLLVERSPQAMIVLQQGGGIQYANAAALKTFGAKRVQELADRPPLELVHPDDHDRVKERRRYWLNNLDTADYFELRRLTVDGRPFHSANYANVIEWEGQDSLLISIIDISDYRNAQAALAESEHRFRDFAQSAADRFWETDEHHRIIFTSQPRDRSVLTGEASAMGRLRWDIPALDATDPKWEQLRRDMQEHLPIRNFRYRFNDSSGRMRYMRMNGVPVVEADGVFRGYRGTTVDETAEMLARQEAEDREKLLRLTTESVPAFIAYHDRDMRFRYANSFYKHIGWDPAKLIGRTIQEVFGNEFAGTTGPFQRVALEGKVVRHENELPTTDGRTLLTESTLIPDIDVAGEVVGFFVMALDVTERRQAERERERSRRSLEAAQRLGHIGSFERFFAAEETTFWTDELYRIFGLEPGSGMSYQHFVELVHPHDRGRVIRVIEKAIRTHYRSFAQEFRIVRPDGSERVVAAVGEIDYDAHGNPRNMLGSLQDITEHKRAQEALEQAKQEAETASRAKTEFLSSMSHELRTPMNAVLGYAQLLLQNKKEPVTQRQRRQINQILKSGQHLLNLINDILDLSRIEAGRIDLELKHVPIDRTVRECVSLMTTLGERNNITIVDKTIGKKPMVTLCDEVRLKQALLNLISNAIKFNRNGGNVTIDWEERPDGAIRISIEDTGDGIPQERWGELFEPFSRLDATQRGIEGTGIGLAISKQLIERMGGHIGFDSEVGRGSTFWIELPQAPTDDDFENDGDPIAESTEPAFRLAYDRPSTLLYIEDDTSNLQLVDEVISHIPTLRLLSAPDAESGLEIARSEMPDVIVMDINLPGMNGFEALSRLKKDPQTQAIPVIALSAAAMAKDIQKGLAAGFFSYLTKPFVIDDLLGTVDRALSGGPGPAASS